MSISSERKLLDSWFVGCVTDLRRLFAGFWYVNKATWHRCDDQVLFLQRELARKNFVKLRSG